MDRLLDMEAFVRVVEAGSFSAAARTWGRSKAVVSKYVARLEEHLGVALLRRTTRSLSLTDAGRAYHARCADLLGELDALETSLRLEQRSPRGTLRVSAPPGFAREHLPALTTRFLERYPDITLDRDLTHRMVDLVEEGIDVAIRVTDPGDSSLIVRKLAPAPIVAVASPGYLERSGAPARPSDLLEHDCLVDTNVRDRDRWRFTVGEEVVTVPVRGPIRVNHPTVLRELAIAGHGIALLPRFVVGDALAAGTLRTVLDGTVARRWSIYAVYPRRRHLSERVRCYVDHLGGELGASTPADGLSRRPSPPAG